MDKKEEVWTVTDGVFHAPGMQCFEAVRHNLRHGIVARGKDRFRTDAVDRHLRLCGRMRGPKSEEKIRRGDTEQCNALINTNRGNIGARHECDTLSMKALRAMCSVIVATIALCCSMTLSSRCLSFILCACWCVCVCLSLVIGVC